jgi:hypothetical protein
MTLKSKFKVSATLLLSNLRNPKRRLIKIDFNWWSKGLRIISIMKISGVKKYWITNKLKKVRYMILIGKWRKIRIKSLNLNSKWENVRNRIREECTRCLLIIKVKWKKKIKGEGQLFRRKLKGLISNFC